MAFSMSNATLPNGTLVTEKTYWQDKVSIKDNIITVQNYGGINITEWYNLQFNMRSKTKNAISPEFYSFRTWAYNFKCTTDKIIAYAPEMVKQVNVTYNTFVPLTGDPKPDTNITDVIVDMSTGFMDRIAEKNCSLSNLQLTKVLFANGTEVVKSLWSSIYLFDSAKKQLTITKYAGLSTNDFNQTRLLFQS